MQVYLAEAGLACLDCPLDEALDISPPLEGGADGGFAMGWVIYLAEAGLACLDCPLDDALDISPPLDGGADGGFAIGWDTSNIFIPEGCLSVILQ